MKGIILAGGRGTRLYPTTLVLSKQLMPVYDKPMIYYPLTTLMLAGIRDILVISTPQDLPLFEQLMGDGSQWGIRLVYQEQPTPGGLAEAFILGEHFLDGSPSTLILGDNVFYGTSLPSLLRRCLADTRQGATIFPYWVKHPERYGVVTLDPQDLTRATALEEKPERPSSPWAITGLYCVDGSAPARAKALAPSPRGELEVTDLMKTYLNDGTLRVETLGRGFAWLDTGTHDSLLQASQFVQTIEQRTGLKIACPEEVALLNRWITPQEAMAGVSDYPDNAYSAYVRQIGSTPR
jgi:glucose-1-phosphate thymidylyltransferase